MHVGINLIDSLFFLWLVIVKKQVFITQYLSTNILEYVRSPFSRVVLIVQWRDAHLVCFWSAGQ